MTDPIRAPLGKTILLCSLGASWAVIPEIYGWLAPAQLDLYAHHPERARLDTLRQSHHLLAPSEIWVCTTGGSQTQRSIQQLQEWHSGLTAPPTLRIWVAEGTDQLASQAECEALRELILRAALKASEQTLAGGQWQASLAGGRKTMSADVQEAASLFGAQACLHVVGTEPMPAELRSALPSLFSQALSPELAATLSPLVGSKGRRSEVLDVEIDQQRVTGDRFVLPLPEAGRQLAWRMPQGGAALHRELQKRQDQSSQLLGNFIAALTESDHYENWRSLYRLPPQDIRWLRETPLGPQHLRFLQQLPKADLHRHIGGSLSLDQQRGVASAIWASLSAEQKASAKAQVAPLLAAATWPDDWPTRIKGAERAAASAALLLYCPPAVLEEQLYGSNERIALKTRHRLGFAAYERPGELTGSAQLCHPAALAAYAEALVQQARNEGLRYLELRGSPHKYWPQDPVGFVAAWRQALQAAGAQVDGLSAQHDGPRLALIWILDRRQRAEMEQIVQQAMRARAANRGFLLGLDLAGDEGTSKPEELAPAFAPAFAACMPITIHAGEGESADNIWQAAYHLHADRIGHGLSLSGNPELAQRFRDRGIALELCPSSNREVVGYFDPAYPESQGLPDYPLRTLLEAGVRLSICTDNPGISRTTLANEYLTAARMDPSLSLWRALALVRQGFAHAMTTAKERDTLIASAERGVFAETARLLLGRNSQFPAPGP